MLLRSGASSSARNKDRGTSWQTHRSTTAFVASLRASLLASFAGNIDTLATFGLTPRQKTVTTPDVKVTAAAKAKATRDARHTMGPKQKAKVKGTVTTTAPAIPVPTAPAPSPTQPVVTSAAPVPATTQPIPPAAPRVS